MIDKEIKQKNGCVKFDLDDSLEYYLQTSQYINKASNYWSCVWLNFHFIHRRLIWPLFSIKCCFWLNWYIYIIIYTRHSYTHFTSSLAFNTGTRRTIVQCTRLNSSCLMLSKMNQTTKLRSWSFVSVNGPRDGEYLYTAKAWVFLVIMSTLVAVAAWICSNWDITI